MDGGKGWQNGAQEIASAIWKNLKDEIVEFACVVAPERVTNENTNTDIR